MKLQKVLIAGEWRESKNPTGSFNATNPANKSTLTEIYPISGTEDIDDILQAGKKAADELKSVSHDKIAEFLELYAVKIEEHADELIEIANIETALPKEPRLGTIEIPRTTGQLRKAASAVKSLSWCNAVIDTESNIRSKFGSLGGPVIVFGPNNFPYAFNSISGGDFAAAIAAGNPVIAKANPAHPGTTKILAEAAFDAVIETGLPSATVQLIYHTEPELGLKLVSHPTVGATAFTGSKFAGLKLKESSDKAGNPIYLEMSSVNPIFILACAISERSEDIAAELFGACALGAGQFCTNPGMIVLQKGDETETFIKSLSEKFAGSTPGTLLTSNGSDNILNALNTLTSAGAQIIVGGEKVESDGYAFSNTLLRVDGDKFLENSDVLQTEAFGTVSLIIIADDVNQMKNITSALEGNLTGSIYTDTRGSDDNDYQVIEPALRSKVGRLINDKMPTGVAVVPSMNHGGPFPATGHPGFTAVGLPASMLRFVALHCYDGVREHRLPIELKDENPTGTMWRVIDGEWTKKDI